MRATYADHRSPKYSHSFPALKKKHALMAACASSLPSPIVLFVSSRGKQPTHRHSRREYETVPEVPKLLRSFLIWFQKFRNSSTSSAPQPCHPAGGQFLKRPTHQVKRAQFSSRSSEIPKTLQLPAKLILKAVPLVPKFSTTPDTLGDPCRAVLPRSSA
jgi:hypothetical protein